MPRRGLARRPGKGLPCPLTKTFRGIRTYTVEITGDGPVLDAISKACDVDESMIGVEPGNTVFQFVTRNASVSRDFKVAMTQLCLTERGIGIQNQEAVPLIEWLTGMNRRVSNVRRYSIYNSIVRTNALHFLARSGK